MTHDLEFIANTLLEMSKKAGADSAEAIILEIIVACARSSNNGDYLLSVIEIRESGEILLNNNST